MLCKLDNFDLGAPSRWVPTTLTLGKISLLRIPDQHNHPAVFEKVKDIERLEDPS